MLGILGKKIGMTHVYKEGKFFPVTLISSGPCKIVYTRNNEKNGYSAVALGYEDQKEHRVSKALKGVFKQAGITALKKIKEFRVEDISNFKLGDQINIEMFKDVKYVDITGNTKGKGFQGGMKRHGYMGGPASHGASLFHRATGSRGSRIGKVIKGKTGPGRMGNDKVTVQRLEIVEIDSANNLLIVKGSIPGANNSYIVVKPSIKS